MNNPCQHCGLEIERDRSGTVWIHSGSRKNWCKRKINEPIIHAQPIGEIVIAPHYPAKTVEPICGLYERGYNAGYVTGYRKAKEKFRKESPDAR